MSGEVSRAKQRKAVAKASNSAVNGNTKSGSSKKVVQNGTDSSIKPSKASFCVRFVFYTLLSTFVVVATLISIDYRAGHLKEAYQTNIPKEVREF